jgi:hypothetical protein
VRLRGLLAGLRPIGEQSRKQWACLRRGPER